MNFQQHKGTGKVDLRTRIIKAYDIGKKGEAVLIVANVSKGMLRGWTFIPVKKLNYLQKQRRGSLRWGE